VTYFVYCLSSVGPNVTDHLLKCTLLFYIDIFFIPDLIGYLNDATK